MQCRSAVRIIPQLVLRRCYSKTTGVPQVAIVGSGPAGFYTAQQLLKGNSNVTVDIYEKLPVPFGLVRFGVAPDHPEVKNVIGTFTQTASHERCNFLGNVNVGVDVTLDDLRRAYTAVVLAYGADDDKLFGIPGEDLNNVLSARSFVGWYNGLPTHRDLKPDLDTDTAVVLGQGNVAIDVARVLLTPIGILKKTDITEYALDVLSRSKVRRVYLVGRRGPLQAAFTIAELREMLKLPSCKPILNPADFKGFQQHMDEIPRARKRLVELMMKAALEEPAEADMVRYSKATREWHLTFLRSPVRFEVDPKSNRVGAIQLGKNRLEGALGDVQKAVPTGEEERLPCGIVFRSIGYRSRRLDSGTPFDDKAAVVPNKQGRVEGHPGLYCSGWIKTGPLGVIATTMNNAFETGKIVVEDLNSGKLPCADLQGRDSILASLKQKGVKPVTFADWGKIDAHEKCRGESCGKPREKLIDVAEMLKVAHG